MPLPKPRVRVAASSTDPWVWSLAGALPNPDAVLRAMGGSAHDLYDRIEADAHAYGELRAVRAGLLSYEVRVMEGDDSRAARRAAELCRELLARPLGGDGEWGDLTWRMALAAYRGLAAHDVVWVRDGSRLVPAEILDIPARRVVFGARDRELRILTRARPVEGEAPPPMQVLLTRHMPSWSNPYGVAGHSACLWPYLFKHAGVRYFVQFAERYGVPWPVGKYPAGSGSERAKELADDLAKMVRTGVLAMPDDSSVEFPTASIRGQSPQERLVELCNREISKALTSQTLATEIQGQGSRAASETHLERERWVAQSDRMMVAASYDRLWRWVTEANFGADVAPPRHVFYEQSHADQAWASVLDTARRYVPISRSDAYERLGLSAPADGEETLAGAQPQPEPPGPPREMSRCPGCGARRYARGEGGDDPVDQAVAAALDAADGQSLGAEFAAPILEAAARDPGLLLERASELLPGLDQAGLEEAVARILFVAELAGAAEADG